MFSEGREDVNDEERAGRPSTSTINEKINEVEKMILANRRITVREVAEDLNISIGSCHSIFINDLGMRRVAAKFVPKLLNCDQKQRRMNIANEMLDSVRDDPNLLQRVITGDEAWVYGYDVETKAQSSQWKLPHEPRPKKARQVGSNVKVLLTVFSDCRGVVHHEFFPQGRAVNKEYYLQVMRNLREAIRQKRPDLWKNKNWLLHHDNAPAHTSLLVRDLLAKNNTLMMPQQPYSPDLAPCDFFLFPKLKRHMKGRRYATLDEIKTASKEELKKILKKKYFLKCFEDWKKPLAQAHIEYLKTLKTGHYESRPSPSFLPYPPLRKIIYFTKSLQLNVTTIYTDGSQSSEGVGAGVILPPPLQTIQLKLHQECSAFQAELLAILYATKITMNFPNEHFIIASDCQSALSAICRSWPPRTQLIAEIIYNLHFSPNVQLCWIKGDSGIPGNELADQAAKAAAHSNLPLSFTTLPKSVTRGKKEQIALKMWTDLYIQDYSSRNLRIFAATRNYSSKCFETSSMDLPPQQS
ncbi:hypothetical protein LAZ67_13001676 [Cordylochernes scorpioides]|uniref:RNase H type-1 domain-containing protein n=1 Tax=Cordylochernes scorpioides TaxID=51811 RepID=A0ABY6L6I7_9ARAC|nr:hypothetical protein LAZ67_13001676 [Cordylochernes scorpioides]